MRYTQSVGFAIFSTLGFALAQSNSTASNSTDGVTLTFDPSTIPADTRDSWCTSQTTSCPLLCLQLRGASDTPQVNTCDSDSLAYDCVCSNGVSPNASEYSQTMAYFICTAEANNCVAACSTADTSCQASCRDDHLCGAQSPTRVTTTSSAASATATDGSSGTSTGGDTVYTGHGLGSASSGAARRVVEHGQLVGMAMFLAGFAGGFSYLL